MLRASSTLTPPDDSGASAQSEPKASKRRCVPSACVPCRKRKSKCDGGTPVCATCTAVYKTDCFYDEASETRRGKAAVKREAHETSDDAERLITVIRNLPPTTVSELLRRIGGDDARPTVAALAEAWKATVNLPIPPSDKGDRPSLESDLSLLMGKPSVTSTGVPRSYGHTSGLGLVVEDEDYTVQRVSALLEQQYHPPTAQDYSGTWTRVTNDLVFVEHLLDLYFQWSHPFYVIFSRECFYRDFRSGRTKYCSSMLIKAILAYACHFSDDPRGRTDPGNHRTAGDHFFHEARKLLYEDETPSLTTTQALCVMAMREPSAGRDSSGFMYIGRCMRMAIELGMQLNTFAPPAVPLTPTEVEVRKLTFWGCFVVDTVWSLCIGRVSQLPRSAITVDKPTIEEITYATAGIHHSAPATVTSRMFIQEFISLAELINDNNLMFFAPKERFSSRRLLAMHSKYQNWYKNLPAPLALPDRPELRPPAHLVILHMLYFATIVHLFRPMLKVDLIGSDLRPRDVCIESANRVSELLRLYRQHYDMRACQLVLTHILLSVSVVHLVYSQHPTCSTNLVEALQALEDMSVCHHYGARSFKIVHTLAKTWNLPWPEALKMSKLVPKEDADLDFPARPAIEKLFHVRSTPPPEEVGPIHYNSRMPAAPQGRRESRSIIASERLASNNSLSSTTDTTPKSQQPPQHHHLRSDPSSTGSPFTPPSAPFTPSSVSTNNLLNTNGNNSLFWTPFTGVGMPILPPAELTMGAMDLDTILGNSNSFDRWNRDGFKISESWAQVEPLLFGGGGSSAGATGDPGVGAFHVATSLPSGGVNSYSNVSNGNGGLVASLPQGHGQGPGGAGVYQGSGSLGVQDLAGGHHATGPYDAQWWGGDGGQQGGAAGGGAGGNGGSSGA